MRILAAVNGRTAERIVRVVLIQAIVFIEYRETGMLERGNIAEHIPHNLEMIIHLTASAHKEALCYIASAVTASARELAFLKQMNVFPLHLTVTNEIESSRQSCKAGTDDVCRLLVNILRFFRVYKRFIGSC